MTDQPSRPDPLAADYGSSQPSADDLPAPPASVPLPTAPPAGPDPTTDRWSAFDATAPTPAAAGRKPSRSQRRRSRRALRPNPPLPQATGPGAPEASSIGGSPAAVRPPAAAPRKRGRSPVAIVLVVLAALLVLPLVSGLVLSRVVGDTSGSDTRSDDPAEKPTLAHTTAAVEPSAVPSVPSEPREVRVEFQGEGRIVDVRLYSDHDGVTRLQNVSLPYAVTVPVADPSDVYFSFDATDYGYRGPQAMRCTVTVGDVVIVTSVGTRRVECGVTDNAWQVRDDR